MTFETPAVVGELRRQLQPLGYEVHRDLDLQTAEPSACYRFAWAAYAADQPDVGPACASELEAWISALAHCLNKQQQAFASWDARPAATMAAATAMGPFHPAQLPAEAFDVQAVAVRFGITTQAAAEQVARMRRQTVYLNERYQVHAEVLSQPFGPELGDVVWLTIKRCDGVPIHDWRELQAIKNEIVGADREGFELYPAEERRADNLTHCHLWVFLDPGVRLPIGFGSRQASEGQSGGAGAGHANGEAHGSPNGLGELDEQGEDDDLD